VEWARPHRRPLHVLMPAPTLVAGDAILSRDHGRLRRTEMKIITRPSQRPMLHCAASAHRTSGRSRIWASCAGKTKTPPSSIRRQQGFLSLGARVKIYLT
jgi:hypothetical protein